MDLPGKTTLDERGTAELVSVKDLRENDIVIVVMGPPNSGKSTFIRLVTGHETLGIGNGLKSFTSKIYAVRFRDQESGQPVVLVDTPGFGDIYNSDLDISNMISASRTNSLGYLYLHRITDNRVADISLENLRMFRKLCRNDIPGKVYFTTTMWDEVTEEVGKRRLEELKSEYWKTMINRGAQVFSCDIDGSPNDLVRRIIIEDGRRRAPLLQNEVAELQRVMEEKDRIITTQNAEIEEWKVKYAAQAKSSTITLHDLEKVRRDLIANEERHTAQLLELAAQVKEWKQLDAAKADKLSTAHRDLEQLRSNLAESTTQVADSRRRHTTESAELTSKLKELERLNITKTQDLATAREQITTLENDRSTSASRITELEQLCETLSTELGSAKDKLKDTDRVIASLTADVDQWKRADAQKAEQITAALERVEELQKDLSVSTSKLADLEARYEAQSHDLASTQISLSQAHEIHLWYDTQFQELKSTVSKLQPKLFDVQRFVTLADEYATKTITQMVENINANSHRTTSIVADCLVQDFQPVMELTEEQTSAISRVSKSTSGTLVDRLEKMKSRDDAASYLRIAMQAYLAYRVQWILSSWTLNKVGDVVDKVLDETYEAMQQNETSTVAGRWRSLTRAYISSSGINDLNTLTLATIEGLSDLAVVAGCATSASAADKVSRFRYSIWAIISAAVQLREVVGSVVSSDFESKAVGYGQPFDASTMEVATEVAADGKGQVKKVGKATARGCRVLCATSLGLTKRELLRPDEDTSTLVKAQVFLE